MKNQGIIFDFNGTLFFDSHYHNQVWKQIALELRQDALSDEELNGMIHGKNNENIIDYLSARPLSREENRKISLQKEAQYRNLVKAHPQTSQLAYGATALLDACKAQGIPFTIATASIKENVDFYVSYFHLDDWMDPSTIVYDDGSYEDKIKMFQDAAKNLHLDIQNCVVFEDSASGIRFAHEAGANTIIAIDSIKEPKRFAQFPYLKGIYEDFTNISLSTILD